MTPNPEFAYHSGGLYEVMLGLVIFAVVWPLRHRFRVAGQLAALVLGLVATGRFVEFFFRSDSPELAIGLNNTQWISLAMLAFAVAGWHLAGRRESPGGHQA